MKVKRNPEDKMRHVNIVQFFLLVILILAAGILFKIFL